MPRFEFSEGTSNKFWEIELSGVSFTTTFGKIGTAGQSSTKEFATEQVAKKEYDKLIAEKTKKGYAPAGASAASASSASASAATPRGAPKAKASALPALPPAPSVPVISAETPPAAISPATQASSEIALDDTSWQWASWRRASPSAAPLPFDRERCLAQLARLKDFEDLNLAPNISDDEAAFWFAAMTLGPSAKPLAERLATSTPPRLSLAKTAEAMKSQRRESTKLTALVLSKLFAPTDIFEMVLDGIGNARGWNGSAGFVLGMRAYVAPRLSSTEREALIQRIQPALLPSHFPDAGKLGDFYAPMSPQFLVAVMLGLHDALLAALRAIPDKTYHGIEWQDAYHMPQLLLFGLNNPADIIAERRRLRLRLHRPEYMTAWIATTEYAGLEDASDAIVDCNNKDDACALGRVLALVRAPANAGPMLKVALKSKAGVTASEWFAANREHAIAGLLEVAKGRALAEAAKQRLAEFGLTAEGKPVVKLPVMSVPAWFPAAAPDKKAAKLVDWLKPEVLPDLDFGGERLPLAQVQALLGHLATASLGAPPAVVSEVVARATPASRDAFAWRLFEAWQEHGAEAKFKWAFAAMGLLGSDPCARKLAPLIRAWPGESQHQRAVLGLDVLGAMGTDVAMMMLNGIAQKVKFKGLQERAREKMDEIAAQRGITAEQLADRLVPDLDLEDDGGKTLSFGARSFRVGFDEALKPFVVDATGAKLAELPKPGSKDDAVASAAATEVWKTMKKDVRALASIQITRLELGMANARRWLGHEFKAFFVGHPLLIHLVRRLVWAVVESDDAQAKVIASFRVAEDRSLSDASDAALELDDHAVVGLVHPLLLDPAELAKWRGVLADYELIQPFEQVSRETFTVEASALKAKKLTRFAKRRVETKKLLSLLNQGWRKGPAQDGGCIFEVYKPIRPGLVATLPLDPGINAGGMDYVDPVQTLGEIEFTPNEPEWAARKDQFALSTVDPITLSEVMRDVERLGQAR